MRFLTIISVRYTITDLQTPDTH